MYAIGIFDSFVHTFEEKLGPSQLPNKTFNRRSSRFLHATPCIFRQRISLVSLHGGMGIKSDATKHVNPQYSCVFVGCHLRHNVDEIAASHEAANGGLSVRVLP